MINAEFITNIIKRYFDEKVINIKEIIGKGFVNRTFLVQTDITTYIIRAREEDAVAEYHKEKWCMEQAILLNIPTPRVLIIDKFESISFIVTTYVEGINGLESSNADEIWYYIGYYAKKLHSLPVQGFGLKLLDKHNGVFIDDFNPTLNKQVDYNISQLTHDDFFLLYSVYDKSDTHDIVNIFEYIKQCNYKIGFNHGDLSRKNTIIDKNGVVTLIDYGCAIVHAVPYFDLTYIFGETVKGREPNESMIKSFIKGYGLSNSELEDMKKDIFAVMLLSVFDKTRWAMNHNDRDKEYYASVANKVLTQTLKFFK